MSTTDVIAYAIGLGAVIAWTWWQIRTSRKDPR